MMERGDSQDNGDDPNGQCWQRANSVSYRFIEVAFLLFLL